MVAQSCPDVAGAPRSTDVIADSSVTDWLAGHIAGVIAAAGDLASSDYAELRSLLPPVTPAPVAMAA